MTRANINKNNKANESIEKENGKEINNNTKIDSWKRNKEHKRLEKCNSQKPGQHQIWERTCINDVNNMKQLHFKNVENLEYIGIFIKNDIVHIGRNDNSSKPVSTGKK